MPKNLFEMRIFHIPSTSEERILPTGSPELAPLREKGISCLGHSLLEKEYAIGRPDAVQHVLLLTRRGCGRLLTPRGNMALTPGKMLFLPIGCPHYYTTEEEPWEILWIHFEKENLWTTDIQSRKYPQQYETSLRLEVIIEGIIKDVSSPNKNRPCLLQAELYMLTELLHLHLPPQTLHQEKADALRLETAWNRVGEKLHYPWTIPEIAGLANLSRSQFARRCREVYGISPGKMLIRRRMHTATLLLLATAWPVYEIAARVGYRDPFAFSSAFHKAWGQCPREYRSSSGEKQS